MNDLIKKIVTSNHSDKTKLERLEQLKEDVETAEKVIKGQLQYCPKCDDYYDSRSFFEETTTTDEEICIFQGVINSGDNEYAPGIVTRVYKVCPKGHKEEIHHYERIKR